MSLAVFSRGNTPSLHSDPVRFPETDSKGSPLCFSFSPWLHRVKQKDDDFVFCWLTGPFSAGFGDCICHGVSGRPCNELHVGRRVGLQRWTSACPLQALCLAWPLLPARQVGLLPTLHPPSGMSHILPSSQDSGQNFTETKPVEKKTKEATKTEVSQREVMLASIVQVRGPRAKLRLLSGEAGTLPGEARPFSSPWWGQLSALAGVRSSSSLASIYDTSSCLFTQGRLSLLCPLIVHLLYSAPEEITTETQLGRNGSRVEVIWLCLNNHGDQTR